MRLRIGTAGWAIPRDTAAAFPSEGSGLTRYATAFDAVEINSTFSRVHRPSTFERWAASTPEGFRFACKFPKSVTHVARLVGAERETEAFVEQVGALGGRRGPLLLQLPPSLAFDGPVFAAFLSRVSALGAGPVVCEPRHASWFVPEVDGLLREARVARVAADPALHPSAGAPGGWRGLAYHRLHGAPTIYRSPYGREAVDALYARLVEDSAPEIWCVFDNTASGAATSDALQLRARALEGLR